MKLEFYYCFAQDKICSTMSEKKIETYCFEKNVYDLLSADYRMLSKKQFCIFFPLRKYLNISEFAFYEILVNLTIIFTMLPAKILLKNIRIIKTI